MSNIDYAALDEALDDELRAQYAQDSDQETEDEASEVLGEASTTPEVEEQQESHEALDDDSSTATIDEIKQEEQAKAVVSESRYKESVRAMNE
jgi:hypothetical protein